MPKSQNEQKVLSKKIFFLDLKGSPASRTRALEIRLRSLGASVLHNFTKSVNVLITNQQLGVRTLRSRARPTSRNSTKDARKEVLEKAELQRAEIKHIDDVSNWINSLTKVTKPRRTPPQITKVSRSPKGRRNVLKVEDNSRAYRPIVKNIYEWPTITTNSRPSTRHAEKETAPTGKSTRRAAITGANQPGYCESCNVRFLNVIAHLNSVKHVKFSSNRGNFKNLDKQLKKGKTVDDFLQEMAIQDSKKSSARKRNTSRPRSAPTSGAKSRTSSKKAEPKLQRTPVRGIGALRSPPDDETPTTVAGTSQATTNKRHLNAVKRKLFSDDDESKPPRIPKPDLSKKARPDFQKTPVRGIGALRSPPENETPTPVAGTSRATTNKRQLNAVKRKLFSDDDDEPTTSSKKKVVVKRRRPSSAGVFKDLQERIHRLPSPPSFAGVQKQGKRGNQSNKKTALLIRRAAGSLKKSLKSNSPVLTSMEMRNGKMKICNGV
ncbi:uncharacterized protein [Antedon mediterranea]|uniref:uncharacterized protein n=1 Tax=Antedon mediterranea TaxID=105859 RepID=UPI003AF69AEF